MIPHSKLLMVPQPPKIGPTNHRRSCRPCPSSRISCVPKFRRRAGASRARQLWRPRRPRSRWRCATSPLRSQSRRWGFKPRRTAMNWLPSGKWWFSPRENGENCDFTRENGDFMVISWWFHGIYPLVNIPKTMENHHAFHGIANCGNI